MKSFPCGRFVVLDGLHLDRNVFDSLSRWAEDRGLRAQDAIQLALCAFGDSPLARSGASPVPPSSRLSACPPIVDRIE